MNRKRLIIIGSVLVVIAIVAALAITQSPNGLDYLLKLLSRKLLRNLTVKYD